MVWRLVFVPEEREPEDAEANAAGRDDEANPNQVAEVDRKSGAVTQVVK